jgi:preprotein translocase subunit SecD
VADTQTDSSKTLTLNDTTKVLVSRTPLVATRDITGATASQTDGQWILNYTVTDDAAKRVQEFTKQHVGRNLALVVDGKSTVRLESPARPSASAERCVGPLHDALVVRRRHDARGHTAKLPK